MYGSEPGLSEASLNTGSHPEQVALKAQCHRKLHLP